MRSRSHWTSCLFLGVGMMLGAGGEARVSGAVFTLGTLAPEGTSYHRSLVQMGEKWRQAPGRPARLRIFAGGKLGGEAKMVSQMRLGALDAGLLTAVGLSEIEPAVAGLQDMPMMFRSLEEVDYIGKKLQPRLEQRLEKLGFVVLFWTDAGWVRFFSKEQLLLPDDLRGMKLFTWAGDPNVVELWKKGGFNPVPLETANIVPMLDTGLINVAAMPPIAALTGQVYGRAPHMLDLNWAPLIGALVMRKAAWDQLPENTRTAMKAAAEEAGEENKQLGRAESDKAVQVMRDKGLRVHAVTPEIEAEWRQTAEKFYPQIKEKIVPAEIFEEVERLLQEFRAAKSASGE